jgi:hypothetical protein
LHVSASPIVSLPGDVIEPHLSAGRLIIDASRFVSKLEYSERYSEMPYITLRPTFLAQEYFDADYVTAACVVERPDVRRSAVVAAPPVPIFQ